MSALEILRPGNSAAVRAAELLAVFSDATSVDAIKNLIVDHAMQDAHAQTGSIDDAIRLLRELERPPRQLLVDVSGSEMPISDLARLAEVCAPSVAVVVIGDRNDVGLFRSLLEIGIQDYLVKPVTVELLRRALAARDPAAQARTGKVISFVGARGGVGVTTIAVSLARHLTGETLRHVVYVDLNLHGGAGDSMLGLRSSNGLAELLQDTQGVDPQSLDRALATAGDRLCTLSSELPYDTEFAVRPSAVTNLINTLKRRFHYVLVDLPCRGGRSVEEALDASQVVCIVADPSVYAARECVRLLRFTAERSSEPVVSVLLNNPLEPVSGRVQPLDFKRALGRASLHELPYDPKSLARAENLGEALPTHKKPLGFAAAIKRISNELTGRDSPPPVRWYSRFTKLGRSS
ncbi:AAA family ATPase [Pandoraea sp. B-6]|uniref:AAA family ATPase n=1 Tax=Pandoraea sp. B-6 TaxID=1204340 RepID=UPI000344EFB2|nr:AAA family ATPase [Pandoraea sp. B-6]